MVGYSASGTVSVRPYVTVDDEAPGAGASGRWRPLQVLVVATCFLLNMLDGMDVLILSYIAPALSSDWHVTPEKLGIVFSAGLAGMAAGGLLIAPMADRYGRRKLILLSLVMMAAAMLGSSFATSILELILARFAVGAGIGTVLASMAALTAEYAPPRHRAFAVGFLQAGYPVGATITGFVVAHNIASYSWQSMLLVAALLCAAAIPLVWLVLPESIAFLLSRRSDAALEKANRLLIATGEPEIAAFAPQEPGEAHHAGLRGLMDEGRMASTLLLWLAIILSFMTLYFVISWIPKLAIEAGLPARDGIYAGAIYNVGAFIGTSSVGLVAMRFDLRKVILVYMLLAAGALVTFGSVSMPLALTLLTAFLIGVFVQGGFNGAYPLATSLYPPEVRSAGLGWAMGMGRIGAVFGPMLGGFLLAAKVSLPVIFGVFAVPVAVAGVLFSLVRLRARH